jgi:hypothetical protein
MTDATDSTIRFSTHARRGGQDYTIEWSYDPLAEWMTVRRSDWSEQVCFVLDRPALRAVLDKLEPHAAPRPSANARQRIRELIGLGKSSRKSTELVKEMRSNVDDLLKTKQIDSAQHMMCAMLLTILEELGELQSEVSAIAGAQTVQMVTSAMAPGGLLDRALRARAEKLEKEAAGTKSEDANDEVDEAIFQLGQLTWAFDPMHMYLMVKGDSIDNCAYGVQSREHLRVLIDKLEPFAAPRERTVIEAPGKLSFKNERGNVSIEYDREKMLMVIDGGDYDQPVVGTMTPADLRRLADAIEAFAAPKEDV